MAEHTDGAERASLTVGGRPIALNRFAEEVLVRVVEGLVRSLRDTSDGEVVLRVPARRRADLSGQ